MKEHEITWDKIMSMPSESISEKVLEFCEEHNLDVSEVLHLFDTKEYKEMLYISCIEHNIIKDDEMKKFLQSRLDVWEN